MIVEAKLLNGRLIDICGEEHFNRKIFEPSSDERERDIDRMRDEVRNSFFTEMGK